LLTKQSLKWKRTQRFESMPATVCTAKASYKKLPGLLELTGTHLQWTQDGAKAPSIRVLYAEAACQSSSLSLKTLLTRFSSFLQQRRLAPGQAENKAPSKQCRALLHIHIPPTRRSRRARKVQARVDDYYCAESVQWRFTCCECARHCCCQSRYAEEWGRHASDTQDTSCGAARRGGETWGTGGAWTSGCHGISSTFGCQRAPRNTRYHRDGPCK